MEDLHVQRRQRARRRATEDGAVLDAVATPVARADEHSAGDADRATCMCAYRTERAEVTVVLVQQPRRSTIVVGELKGSARWEGAHRDKLATGIRRLLRAGRRLRWGG